MKAIQLKKFRKDFTLQKLTLNLKPTNYSTIDTLQLGKPKVIYLKRLLNWSKTENVMKLAEKLKNITKLLEANSLV